DATSFLGKLRGKTGLDFDLPTEAQWEYACRAGTATALNSGKDWTGEKYCPNMNEVGRYYENGGEAGEGNSDSDASVGSAIVGSYRPNGWGLYDMHGNVWEWCLDWSNGSDYPGGEVTDPKGGSDGDRVHRGGAWYSGARYCRSAYRSQIYPSLRYLSLGFRLAWPVP
ncbi:MAG: formylglycine-generating enzyme family protein, partial [Lentisphaerae bacterium]|nr:formylglycine-generating enzyme family protein [Lentisphaerota bacterium]